MTKIKTVQNEKELKKVFDFLSNLFYDDAIEYNEHYHSMGERFSEMKEQLQKDKEFLLYIEENNEIIAAVSGKKLDIKERTITLGVMGVSKKHRRKGYAKLLVNEFEKRCIEKGIKHITLGARFRACPLYISMDYKPSLMIQVFDFATIEDIKKENKFNLEVTDEMQGETYGFIFFKVEEMREEYIKYFEKKVKTAHAQYIFNKNL